MGLGFRFSGLGFRVEYLGFRVSGLGFWVEGGFGLRVRGFEVWDVGCRVEEASGFGFRVSSFGFRFRFSVGFGLCGFGFRVPSIGLRFQTFRLCINVGPYITD